MEELTKTYLEPLLPYLQDARVYVNNSCAKFEAWQIISLTFGATLLFVAVWEFLFQEESLKKRIVLRFWKFMRKLPFVKNRINKEVDKTMDELNKTFNHGITKGYIHTLPEKGWSEDKLMKELDDYKSLAKVKWDEGFCSGTVYNGDQVLTTLMAKVYGQFAWSNPLHADVFPDVRKMEAEVVRMTCDMFNGGPESCGAMTSGGTESIMLACKAYRDIAMDRGVKHPEMIVPITVHAAFDKAAQYFQIKITHIPIDEETRQVNVKKMRSAINGNTCMLVGSAPSFPHGIIDNIGEISKLGQRYGLPVHVDCCLGGFLVPFMEKAGITLEPFDFRCPGVTSISADTHKFGFAPKGSSVILYSHRDYRQWQYFVQPDWPGGIYASPTFAGSRPGAIIAACWATMVYYGLNGYIDSTRKITTTLEYIVKELKKIDGIKVYGDPKVCVVGVGSDVFNIFRLSDALTRAGWNLNPLQFPSSIHLCVTFIHTQPGVADKFLDCMRKEVAEIMKTPNAAVGGAAALYGMAQSIPDRSIVGDIAGHFWDAYYLTSSKPQQNGAM